MNVSTLDCLNPCTMTEEFNVKNITAYAGANIIVDFMNSMGMNKELEDLSVRKVPWAVYSAGLELQMLMTAYTMGISRIEHTDVLKDDPIFRHKLDLDRFPHKSNTYRLLERFKTLEQVDELSTMNSTPLAMTIDKSKPAIMDIDTTVNTVHGHQEGTTVGYNPRYHGRGRMDRYREYLSCFYRSLNLRCLFQFFWIKRKLTEELICRKSSVCSNIS